METIKSKILKLQALVERGENGEATNAKRLLDKLLLRHGITLEDILLEKEEKKWYEFNARKGWEKELLNHCYFKILDVDEVKYKETSRKVFYELTAYEYAEMANYYEWHKNQLGKELKQMVSDFTEAYIIRHHITSERTSDEQSEDKPLTLEERQRLFKIYHLVETVEDTSYRKMIK